MRYLHVEVVMSGEVGVEDELLHQVIGGVEQDVLEKGQDNESHRMK